MCWQWGKGDDSFNVYWLLRQWRHRADAEGRAMTAQLLSYKIGDIQTQLVRKVVNREGAGRV